MTPFKSFAQNFEDVMLWRALWDVEDGFYIDVGAAEPYALSVTAGFYDRGWRGINIEPQDAYFEHLQEARPEDINLKAIISEETGARDFYTVNWRNPKQGGATTGLATVSKDIADGHDSELFVVNPTTRNGITLTQICECYANEVIHFLKIDVEGAEADVLRSLDFKKYRPWIVVIEATEPTPISKDPDIGSLMKRPKRTSGEWEHTLLDEGYKSVWFDGLNEFYVCDEKYDDLAHHFELPPNVFDRFTRPGIPKKVSKDPLRERVLNTPKTLSAKARLELSRACRDADHLPRVKDAGKVIEDADGMRHQIMHNGLKVVADGYCGPWMTDLIREGKGVHEPQEEALFADILPLLPDTATMLEIGSYWSYYSLWFLQGAPKRRAFTLEPDTAHATIGARNATLNNLSPVVLPNGTIGAEPEKILSFESESSGVLDLPQRSVPDIMKDQDLDHLSVLHCDAQGAEVEMLKGCARLFERRLIDWVFVSTHHHEISKDPLTHQKCEILLRDAGATIVRSIDVQESYSGDGLIVARFCEVPEGWTASKTSYCRASQSLFRNPLIDLAEAKPFKG